MYGYREKERERKSVGYANTKAETVLQRALLEWVEMPLDTQQLPIHFSNVWCIILSKHFINRSSGKNSVSINPMACYNGWGLAKAKADG